MTRVSLQMCPEYFHRTGRKKESAGRSKTEEQRGRSGAEVKEGEEEWVRRRRENTHFFQPTTRRIRSWKCWKQLKCPQFEQSACREGKLFKVFTGGKIKSSLCSDGMLLLRMFLHQAELLSFSSRFRSSVIYWSLWVSRFAADTWKLLVFWWGGWGGSRLSSGSRTEKEAISSISLVPSWTGDTRSHRLHASVPVSADPVSLCCIKPFLHERLCDQAALNVSVK